MQFHFELHSKPKLGAVKLETSAGCVTMLPTGREVSINHLKLLFSAMFPALSTPVKTTVWLPPSKFDKTNNLGWALQIAVHNTVAVTLPSTKYQIVHPLASVQDTVNRAVVAFHWRAAHVWPLAEGPGV